jgi:hypothetical protein
MSSFQKVPDLCQGEGFFVLEALSGKANIRFELCAIVSCKSNGLTFNWLLILIDLVCFLKREIIVVEGTFSP